MKGRWNNRIVELPDFIIPGAAKSGTTTLYRILQKHPDIYVPTYNKETYFFSYFDRKLQYEKSFLNHAVTNPIEYLSIFKERKHEKLIGEASIGYLYDHGDCIANMKKFYGDNMRKVKIPLILRNPIDRAFSHYTFLIRNGFEELAFEEAILPEIVAKRKKIRPGFDYLEYGKYFAQVAGFMQNFDEVKVFLFNELQDFSKLNFDLCTFLGVNVVPVKKEIRANPSGVPKNKSVVHFLRKNPMAKKLYRMFPKSSQAKLLETRDRLLAASLKKQKMLPATRKNLIAYFEEDISKLSKLIDRDLSHWLEMK